MSIRKTATEHYSAAENALDSAEYDYQTYSDNDNDRWKYHMYRAIVHSNLAMARESSLESSENKT